MRKIFKIKGWRGFVKLAIFGLLLVIAWSNYSVWSVSSDYVYENMGDVPVCKTGVLLGTSKMMANGTQNLFFTYRIDAAVSLYKAGKIKHILISGDNGTKDYNEPDDMKQALIAKGIPAAKIHLDYAGFDTYDSMIRASKVFGQRKFIVISQKFHIERAVYIARKSDIEAYGFAAQEVKKMGGFKTKVREVFARVKAFKDVLFGVEPTYLGESEAF